MKERQRQSSANFADFAKVDARKPGSVVKGKRFLPTAAYNEKPLPALQELSGFAVVFSRFFLK